MSTLTREVQNVQNSALGATMLWRFACGYTVSHPTREPLPLLLLFLVLPIILHEQTEEFVNGTQKASGMRVFAAKFGKTENSKQDILLAIHERMLAFRNLSMDSLRICLSTRLLHMDGATVIPLSEAEASVGIPSDVRRLMKSSEKLGAWCGLLTLHEISAILKLRF
jgi:hypothetical protein